MNTAQATTGVTLEVDTDQVGWLVFDQPGSSLNILSRPVMGQLDRLLSEAESRIATGKLVAVVVRSGKPGSFIAGADVDEIAGLRHAREARDKAHQGQRIFRRLEMLRVPTCALIDGICLGGGTELVLACTCRLASDRGATRIGFPETRLGILPGFGGSVRLPRLVGIQNALDIILPGKSVSAGRARRIGLVDRVVPPERLERAVADFVQEVIRGDFERRPSKVPVSTRLLEGTPIGRKILFSIARRRTRAETKGHYPAPLRAIDVIEKTHGMQLDRALEVEAEALGELAVSPEARNLIRVFQLQQGARKAMAAGLMETRKTIEKAAVIGAGVMGGAIAEVIAAQDIPVVMKDINQRALDAGLHHASDLLKKAAAKRVFTREEASLKFALIQGSLDYGAFSDVDLTVEAVIERMPVKQQVLRESEDILDAAAVFATNTSSLSVTELAGAARHPERVLGLHFFNPVHKMPLVEVIRTDATSESALATAFGFVLDLGKTPVLVADQPGFLVNRLLAPYLNEAGYLLDEGASIELIDRAMIEFGMPMGPCRLLDEIGFDVAEHVSREMEKTFGDRMRPSRAVARLREGGRLGRKNGRGFYRYDEGREKGVDPAIASEIEAGGKPAPDADQIRRRCLYLMVNEAAYALADGVVRGADDIDIAMILGTGFPPFRGGLLRWAEGEGLDAIVERLDDLASRDDRFTPAPLLRTTAAEGGSFTGGA